MPGQANDCTVRTVQYVDHHCISLFPDITLHGALSRLTQTSVYAPLLMYSVRDICVCVCVCVSSLYKLPYSALLSEHFFHPLSVTLFCFQ